jgi:DNA-binding NarL/FixJ family response regulator
MRRSVLIVDDSPSFRMAARALLEDDGFICMGEAAEGAGALRALEGLRPDVVLLDIALPGDDGIDIAERMASLDSPPAVVLISSRPAAVYGDRLAEAPVRGFLAKHELSGAALSALLE